jgi:alpha-beta hydrolase superfamily lysophospholipase
MNWPLLLALALGLLLAGLIYLAFAPPRVRGLASRPRPATNYEQALERVAALHAQEAAGHNPLCHTQLLTHGQPTARCIAFIHGYTNCPMQFAQLAEAFHQRGYNTLTVLLPHHGLADRLTDAHRRLTAEELVAYADEVVDIARGLGEHVTLLGLSGGGVVAAWAAQTRADVHLAVVMAPNFGFKAVPRRLTRLVANLVLFMPDVVLWWNPFEREKGRLEHVYPRFTLHGLTQQWRLGFAARKLAEHQPPAARAILVVTNAHDPAVDNPAITRMVAHWREWGSSPVRTYEFPAELKLLHDVVDPGHEGQRVDVVYPKLIELIDGTQGGL